MGHAKLDKYISKLAKRLEESTSPRDRYNIVRTLRKKIRKQKKLINQEVLSRRQRQIEMERALMKRGITNEQAKLS